MSYNTTSILARIVVLLLIVILICPMVTIHFDSSSNDMELCEESEGEKESELKEELDDKLLADTPGFVLAGIKSKRLSLILDNYSTSGPYRDIHSPPPECF